MPLALTDLNLRESFLIAFLSFKNLNIEKKLKKRILRLSTHNESMFFLLCCYWNKQEIRMLSKLNYLLSHNVLRALYIAFSPERFPLENQGYCKYPIQKSCQIFHQLQQSRIFNFISDRSLFAFLSYHDNHGLLVTTSSFSADVITYFKEQHTGMKQHGKNSQDSQANALLYLVSKQKLR